MTLPANRVWDAKAIEAMAPDAASVPAARKVLAKGGFTRIQPTADGRGWWCVCKGMTDTYQVSARLDPAAAGGLASDCTCPSPKRPCKHALALMLHLADHPDLRPVAEAKTTTASEFEPLLRAVFAAPDDDTPRLVFADHLEETGDADRAALIRVQCELARLPSRSVRRTAVQAEEKKLLARVKKRVGTVPEQFKLAFERGFAELTLAAWAGLGDVNGWPAGFADLFRRGWVRRLAVRGEDFPFDPAAVPYLRLAGELDFSTTRLSEDALAAVAAEVRPDRSPESRLASVRVHRRDEPFFREHVEGDAADLPAGPPGYDNTGPIRHYIGLTAAQVERMARTDRFADILMVELENAPGDAVANLAALATLPRLS
jgi:uncharacterized protein (TIGR02996 family)